ncbi:MAG: hypothetical protein ACI35O_13305 [Bacillaceae bacterium]
METKDKVIIIGIASTLALTIWNTRLYGEIERLREEVRNYQDQVAMIQGNLEEQISTITTEVKKEASLLSNATYTFKEWNKKDKTIPLLLQATPKRYTEGMKVSFVYKVDEGTEQVVAATKGAGQTFTATIPIPLADSVTYSVILDDGKVKQTENLEAIYDIKRQYALEFNAWPTNAQWREQNGTITYTGGATLQAVQQYDPDSNKLTNAAYEISQNGETILSKKMKKKEISLDDYNMEFTYELKSFKLKVKPGDTIEFIVKGGDTNGFTYKKVIEKWKIDENNEVSMDEDGDYMNVIIE